MTACDRIAALLPFHAAGLLDEEDRLTVAGHLPGCADCRDLLAHARALRWGARRDDGEGHVQSQLLVEYQEAPAQLDEGVRRSIDTHLAACDLCAGAWRILEDLPAQARNQEPAVRPRDHPQAAPSRAPWAPSGARRTAARRGWPWLWRPLPALAFAVLLVAMIVPAYLVLGPAQVPLLMLPGEPGAPAVPGAAILVTGEDVFRGAGVAAGGTPLDLTAAADRPLVLELGTDLDEGELGGAAPGFVLELLRGDEARFRRTVTGEAFDARGRLRVVLDAAALEPGVGYDLVVRYGDTGDLLAGTPVFRRRIRVVPPE